MTPVEKELFERFLAVCRKLSISQATDEELDGIDRTLKALKPEPRMESKP